MIERLIRKHLGGFSATCVLDVGPGYGDFSRVVASVTKAQKVWYVDLNEKVLAWQTRQASISGLRAEALPLDLSKEGIDRLPCSYDVILCQEVLEHLQQPALVLSALIKKLHADGRIIITVPSRVSERLIRWLNPSYMKNELNGHVTEFSEASLKSLVHESGGTVLAFVPTQPHYFLAHLFLYFTRAPVEGATGRILKQDVRAKIFELILRLSLKTFKLAWPELWGRLLPRNYFVVATKSTIVA
jgi:SAM-dependent methyltransferase